MSSMFRTVPSVGASIDVERNCPICGDDRRAYLFVVRGLPVVRCHGCGLISLSPQPRKADLRTFYAEAIDSVDPRLLWQDGKTEADAASRYLNILAERGIRSGRLLLVAPPDHRFAKEAQSKNFEVALHVSISDLEQYQAIGDNIFDVAVILYQLEKSTEPARVLEWVRAHLRTGGALLIALPSLDSWPARFLGEQWTEWRPENLYYFDRTSIQSLLLKAGFDELRIDRERRLYTLRHIHDRAAAFPRTLITRIANLINPFVPSVLRESRIRVASSGMIVTASQTTRRARPLCSIVVPAFNEAQTFPTLMNALLAKTLPGADKEIIIVESNSRDGTRELALQYEGRADVKLILEDRPRGKGHAVRAGLAHATGDIVMIQDADLEYDLMDYDGLIEPLLSYRAAFVLGARHGGSWKMRSFAGQQSMATMLNVGHVFFTTLINVLYGQSMSDPFTMFKLFRRDCLCDLTFECNRFDFDHELVIKLVRKGYRPLELPVNYRSRSFKEGKKVSLVRDPLSWLWIDFKLRFAPTLQRIKR